MLVNSPPNASLSRERLCILVVVVLSSLVMTGCDISLDVHEESGRDTVRRDELLYDNTEYNHTDRETEERFVYNIHAEEIPYDNDMKRILGVGEVIDFYDDGVIAKLVLTEVISGRDLRISINNRRSEIYHKTDNINIFDDVHVAFDEIFFHANQSIAGATISMTRKDSDSFPDYLIENQIGLNSYISSHRIDNSERNYSNEKNDTERNHTNNTYEIYEAHYDMSTVRVTKGAKFARFYPDSRNIIDFDDRKIYLLPEERKAAWVSYRGGEEYIIEVDNPTETMIREYFWDYPSFLNMRTLCMRRLVMGEEDRKVEDFNDDILDIRVNEISASDFDVNITVAVDDHEGSLILAPGEKTEKKGVIIILNRISVDDELSAEICLV